MIFNLSLQENPFSFLHFFLEKSCGEEKQVFYRKTLFLPMNSSNDYLYSSFHPSFNNQLGPLLIIFKRAYHHLLTLSCPHQVLFRGYINEKYEIKPATLGHDAELEEAYSKVNKLFGEKLMPFFGEIFTKNRMNDESAVVFDGLQDVMYQIKQMLRKITIYLNLYSTLDILKLYEYELNQIQSDCETLSAHVFDVFMDGTVSEWIDWVEPPKRS